jgi:hypothetical protein
MLNRRTNLKLADNAPSQYGDSEPNFSEDSCAPKPATDDAAASRTADMSCSDSKARPMPISRLVMKVPDGVTSVVTV